MYHWGFVDPDGHLWAINCYGPAGKKKWKDAELTARHHFLAFSWT